MIAAPSHTSNTPEVIPARLPWLDVLRGIAVILVLFRHMDGLLAGAPDWVKRIIDPLVTSGWMGVDLFFVLSGFLVGSLLLRPAAATRPISISRFLLRRGFKIYPTFYLLLVVTIGSLFFLTGKAPWPRILAEGFFVQNYLPGIWQHTWSLAVEEHFYLVLAALVAALAWTNRDRQGDPYRVLPWVIGVIAIACLLLRAVHYLCLPEQRGAIYRSTHLRIDSLFVGVMVAYLAAFHATAFRRTVQAHRWVFIVGGALLISPAWIWPLSTHGEASGFLLTIGFSTIALGCACWVALAVVAGSPERSLGGVSRAIGFVGVHSYAIYVWHLPVKFLFPMFHQRLFGNAPSESTQLLVYVGGTFLLALVTSRLLEFPVLRWRDRFFPATPAATQNSVENGGRPASVGLAIS